MDGVFCFGWERLEILHLPPWGKKPKKIAFYPKKMVHEGLQRAYSFHYFAGAIISMQQIVGTLFIS